MASRIPFAARFKDCQACGAPWHSQRFPPGLTQRAAALAWLAENQKLWRGKVVKRFSPMNVSPAWYEIARGLKLAGIYSPIYNAWDMRIENLIAEVRATLAAGRKHNSKSPSRRTP